MTWVTLVYQPGLGASVKSSGTKKAAMGAAVQALQTSLASVKGEGARAVGSLHKGDPRRVVHPLRGTLATIMVWREEPDDAGY